MMTDTSDVKKKRPIRKQLNLCRICLTCSPSVKNLNENFERGSEILSIQEVLKTVLCSEILVTPQTPEHICLICLSFLKISYDFKRQFEDTQKKLFGNLNLITNQKSVKTSKEVELIVGGRNFNLDDVVIVDDNEKKEDVSELLNKIGKTVTVECIKNKDLDKVSEQSNACNITSNGFNDEEFETIIIEFVSDNDELLENQVEKNKNLCTNRKIPKNTIANSIIGSFIIEDGKRKQISEPFKNIFSNENIGNFTIKNGTVGSTRNGKATSAELREIEKYILCDGDIAENEVYEVDNFLTETIKKDSDELSESSPDQNSNVCQLAGNIQQNKSDIFKYYCKECAFSFKTEKSLKCHVCFVHGTGNSDLVENNFNSKTFEDREKSRDQKKLTEEEKIRLKQEKMLTRDARRKLKFQKWKERFKRNPMLCQICGHVAVSSGGARYHSLTHGERRFKCNICSTKFYTKSHLKNHLNCKHEKKMPKHLCPLCGEYRNSPSALKYHMKVHNNEPKKFACHICGISFLVQGALTTHLRRHVGDRRYNCNFCEKSFFTNDEKKKHTMIHTGERPFKCKYCEKIFATPFNRKVHMMTHSGPNLCKICFRGMADESLLELHMQYKHCIKKKYKKKRPSSFKVVPDTNEKFGEIKLLEGVKDEITEPLECTETDGEIKPLESVKESNTEYFGFPQHSPSTSSDILKLEVFSMLDGADEGALKFYEVDVI